MEKEATAARYEPDPEFEEVKEEAMLDLSPTDSKEFWLIQWIKDKDFNVSDFHGKDASLELKRDGNLGSLESSSGKSFQLLSYAYQKPNATVFLPTGSEMKAVGKISRRVCLVHHGEREGLERPNFERKGLEKPNAEREGLVKPNSRSPTSISKKSAVAEPDPKTQLHIYARRRGLQPPIFRPIQKGPCLEPPFKSEVVIDGLKFVSPKEYPSRKAAERAAAQLALTSLLSLPRQTRSQAAGYLTKNKKLERISCLSGPNTTKLGRNKVMLGLRSIRQGL